MEVQGYSRYLLMGGWSERRILEVVVRGLVPGVIVNAGYLRNTPGTFFAIQRQVFAWLDRR